MSKIKRAALICIPILLAIGIIVLCVAEIKGFNEKKQKKITGAREVFSRYYVNER